jgi:hypothetical protein
MATYFFHLRNGDDLLQDAEGRSLRSERAIAAAALHEARAILSADIPTEHVNLDQRIEVENARGAVIHKLHFGDAVDFCRRRQGERHRLTATDQETPDFTKYSLALTTP